MQFCFSGNDAEMLAQLRIELAQDLSRYQLDNQFQLGEIQQHQDTQPVRGADMVTWVTVALAAVSAGGALTVALSKDGFLSKLARVLEKQVENQKVEINIEHDGKKIRIEGPASKIESIIKQITKL